MEPPDEDKAEGAYTFPTMNDTFANTFASCGDEGGTNITNKITSHSFQGFVNYTKNFILEKYKIECTIDQCYFCN